MPEFIDPGARHIIQAYGISILGPKNKLLKQLNKYHAPSVHGDQNWLSSFLIADYLLHHPLQDKPLLDKRSKVLELGCGWGPASIFCAHHAGCKVTGLDIDEDVFPYLEVQAELNDVKVSTRQGRFEELDEALLKKFDVLIGADICFWDELQDVLFQLIRRALKAGVKDIILADPGRSPFLKLAKRCEKSLKAEEFSWYCTEPKRFEGYVLHIKKR